MKSNRSASVHVPDALEIDVFAGGCRIRFRPNITTGRDNDTRPGVAFDFEADGYLVVEGRLRNEKIRGGMGVIRRSDAQKLADMLNAFLREYPAPSPPQAHVEERPNPLPAQEEA